jgi:hypothetical protein
MSTPDAGANPARCAIFTPNHAGIAQKIPKMISTTIQCQIENELIAYALGCRALGQAT